MRAAHQRELETQRLEKYIEEKSREGPFGVEPGAWVYPEDAVIGPLPRNDPDKATVSLPFGKRVTLRRYQEMIAETQKVKREVKHGARRPVRLRARKRTTRRVGSRLSG